MEGVHGDSLYIIIDGGVSIIKEKKEIDWFDVWWHCLQWWFGNGTCKGNFGSRIIAFWVYSRIHTVVERYEFSYIFDIVL